MSTDVTMGSLLDALDSVGFQGQHAFGIGYILTPRSVTWVRRAGRKLVSASGPIELDWVFEARLFGAEGDLRWKWHQDHGRWTVIDDTTVNELGWRPLNERARQRTRLLRGSAQRAGSNGWTSLWDGQAAPFEIPLELAEHGGALLTVIEYVQQDPAHGTVDVVAERFVALKALEGTKG